MAGHADTPGSDTAKSGTAAPPSSGKLLAIDWGEKRIGLALSDPEQRIAHPLGTLTRRRGRRFPLQRLRVFLDEHHPVGIVVGVPLSEDGTDGPEAHHARAMGALVHTKTGLPTTYWDERMTTARALRAVRDLGGSTRERKSDVDPLAATVLLQTYLDALRQ